MDLSGPSTAKANHVNDSSMYVTAKLAIAHGRMLEQCLGFRAECHATGNAGEIERLDAQPLAREHEPSATRVPQCDREHAVEVVQEVQSAVLVEMDEHFGVGMVGGEPVPGWLQRFAQLHVIVDLA